MVEFTKGIWKLNPVTAIISAHTDKSKTEEKLIATVFGATLNSVANNTEALTNACLIENAPAMYALLEYIKHELHEYGNSYWDWDLRFDIGMLLDRINGNCNEDNPTLKLCPFCSKSNAYVATYMADYAEKFTVKFAAECPNCDCSTRLYYIKEEAIDSWNMRDGKEERTGNNDE